MTGFYDEMASIASGLISEFKQGDVTYIELLDGNGPDDNPGPPIEAPPIKLEAVARNAEFKYIDGTLIESTTTQLTFAPPNETLVLDDLDYVIIDGQRYKIIKKMTIPPMGVPIVHVIFVNR